MFCITYLLEHFITVANELLRTLFWLYIVKDNYVKHKEILTSRRSPMTLKLISSFAIAALESFYVGI